MFDECTRMLALLENLMRKEFDADWFRTTYPEFIDTNAADDAETTFEAYRIAVREAPVKPNVWFDEDWYRRQYPMVSRDVSGPSSALRV